MGVFEPSVMWGHDPPSYLCCIGPMIKKFGTGMKLDVFDTMVTKKFVTLLLLRNYDVITCILADV